jgi:predicted acylesterase/phospholipase RssA
VPARATPLLLALLCLALPAATSAAPDAAAQPEGARIPLALTISGGVSLGSYEAGLVWSFVRAMKAARRSGRNVDLASVTGASAGSINALLAAALWCEDEQEERDLSVEHNLFHETWLPVGVDELLPDEPQKYQRGDGLLSGLPLERQLASLQALLFGNGARKLRPGCLVPLGFTVTRSEPEEREVSGLRARAQRFAVPLVFEVTWDGRPRISVAQLPADRPSAASSLFLGLQAEGGTGLPVVSGPQLFNGILASGAFPFAFRPRELCDCALVCAAQDRVFGGSCPGPSVDRPLQGLTCATVLPAQQRMLCKHSYVDGGIFDNAPVGLGIDLAEWVKGAGPLQPTTYLMFDPDFRRFTPPEPGEAVSSHTGLAGPLSLLANLVATARSTELSSAVRADGWNRTTRRTLAAGARLNQGFTELREEVVRVATGGGMPESRLAMPLLRHPERERIGRVLLRCLAEMKRSRYQDPLLVSRCAGETMAAAAPEQEGTPAQRLTPDEVFELARHMAAIISAGGESQARPMSALIDAKAPLEQRLRALEVFRDGATLVGLAFRFVDGEIEDLVRARLPEASLRAFRRDLLETVRASTRVARASDAMVRVTGASVLAEELPEEGKRVAALLLAGELGEPIDGPAMRALADVQNPRSARLDQLIALGPKLRTLMRKTEEVARLADQLSEGDGNERQLVVSRRFAPLASSLLGAFGGFLDRPLRETDYLIGVYDTARAFATYRCQTHSPYEAATQAVFKDEDPLELELREPQTWRCIAAQLEASVLQLGLDRSPRARHVIGRLFALELLAALDDEQVVRTLRQGPEFAWLEPWERELPGDAVAQTLSALTAKRLPCSALSAAPHCLGDPSFDELVESLQQAGYRPVSKAMATALADREAWMSGLVRKLSDRSASIELENAARAGERPGEGLLLGVGAGELWSRRALQMRETPRLVIDPSSIPGRPLPGTVSGGLLLGHLVPYRVSLDVAKGGIALSWLEPQLRLTPWFSVQSITDVIDIDGNGRFGASFGALPTFTALGASLSGGLRWTTRLDTQPKLPGWVVRLALAQERLSIALGMRTLEPAERAWSVTLSISDLNGLGYWLSPFTAGEE